MKLWTWQGPEQSLTSGCVDVTKSHYWRTITGVPEAYAKLADILGTDQLIWCYVCPDKYITWDGDQNVCWSLDVPDSAILQFTNDYVWNRILKQRIRPPQCLYHEWNSRYPLEESSKSDFLERREEEYYSQEPRGGSWWPHLFIDPSNLRIHDKDQLSSALLRHPLLESWVVAKSMQ